MELIPTLKRWGYHYVLVDSEYVQPVTPMRWEKLRYRPHLARFGGEEIIVVIRDRALSNAQEGGMEPGWFNFYHGLMERVRATQSGGIHPVFIDEYLDSYGAHGEVSVDPGAWNAGWHHGTGLLQWTGSQAQQEALIRLAEISQAIHAARRNAIAISARDPELYRLLAEAHWRALRAETSCNFFWGEAWVPRVHHDLDQASRLLDEAGAHFS